MTLRWPSIFYVRFGNAFPAKRLEMVSPADIDAIIHFSKPSSQPKEKKHMPSDSPVAAILPSPALMIKNAIHTKRKSLVPRTQNQAAYVDALRKRKWFTALALRELENLSCCGRWCRDVRESD